MSEKTLSKKMRQWMRKNRQQVKAWRKKRAEVSKNVGKLLDDMRKYQAVELPPMQQNGSPF